MSPAKGFSVSADIDAPPEVVYSIVADYHDGHLRILPRPPFVSLTVERGGTGAGTVLRVTMRLLGRLQTFRATVTEPVPGRVLVESNETGYVTTFTVEPLADADRARVTIATALDRGGGVREALERWVSARLLRPVYAQELRHLAAVAATRSMIRVACPADLPSISALLAGSKLPTSGVAEHLGTFVVFETDGAVVAVGGLEMRGRFALLRSLTVAPTHRGRGVARALCDRLEAEAARRGASHVYLLTETSARFFLERGYATADRSTAPDEIASAEEFASICPQSAGFMGRAV
jgi:amino-acid N-acetyltransferase